MVQFLLSYTVLLGVLAASTAAKVVTIEVGQNGNSYFKPDYSKANVGDIVEFVFDSKEHSVVQGDFFTGCYPIQDGGFYSGKQKQPMSFRVNVNNTDPIMVYSSAGLECQIGMVAVINANAVQTLTKYREKAKTSFKNASPKDVFGGVLAKTSSGKGSKESSAGQLTANLVNFTTATLAVYTLLIVYTY